MPALSDVIKILDVHYQINYVSIQFELTRSPRALIEICSEKLQPQCHTYNVRQRSNAHHHCTCYVLKNTGGWERLGAAFGRNLTVRDLRLSRRGDYNNVSEKVFQCIEALYRGIQTNTTINKLEIYLDLFPCDGSLPTLNLQEAQFKESLKHLELKGEQVISTDQCVMIQSFIESTTLEKFRICHLLEFERDNVSVRMLILACANVKRLELHCESAFHYDSVALLLGNPRSMLSEMNIGWIKDTDGLSSIAEGLANNSTLRTLCLSYSGDWGPMAKALCDTSTIQRIITSNHTLESIWGNRYGLPPLIRNYLKLNSETNKELVIRKKISLYYFRGEYDVSTFETMDIKCLPRVLAMIGGGQTIDNAEVLRKDDKINQYSAIFRMLKCIPYLCSASSKDEAMQVNGVS